MLEGFLRPRMYKSIQDVQRAHLYVYIHHASSHDFGLYVSTMLVLVLGAFGHEHHNPAAFLSGVLRWTLQSNPRPFKGIWGKRNVI